LHTIFLEKQVAKKLETAAIQLCPFCSYMTPFGIAKAVRLRNVEKDRAIIIITQLLIVITLLHFVL
jgi:hypothetical protein